MADYVAALRGRMGDWQYYVTVMPFGKIARECKLAEQIHTTKDLDELLQRAIQDRVAKEMVPYLLNEPQHFYGALVVAVYLGEPEFSPVKVEEHHLIDDKEGSSYGFGLLRFDGSQVYYALDGQHRLKSIQQAIDLDPDIAKEQICVIILKHENSKEGMERTRRLFSTLNSRAKPTSPGLNIAIDEDDSIAIVTRRLVKENKLLERLILAKVAAINSKSITPTKNNDPYITTLAAFYETNEILLGGYGGGLEINRDFKQFRKTFEELDTYYAFLETLWMRMLEKCPDFEFVVKGQKKPGDIRRRTNEAGQPVFDDSGKAIPGGSAFARPIGQFIVAEVLKAAAIQGKHLESAIDAIMSGIPMDIDSPPWAGVIWNTSTHRIIGGKAERKLLVAVISHALGLKVGTKIADLKQNYRNTTGNKKAMLLSPVVWSGQTEIPEGQNDADDAE